MTLNDIKRYAIKNQSSLTFPIEGGLNCVVNEHGIVKVPGLAGPPTFDLDKEFAVAAIFTVEPVATGKEKPKPVRMPRAELAAKLGSGGAADAHDEHEE